MKKLQAWAMLVLFVAVIVGGLAAWWALDLRYRPHTIAKHQPEIAKLVEQAGWVSPGLTGPKLYMVSFRDCPYCLTYRSEEFPKLQAAGVDTREIMVALRDVNGAAKSTAAERSTVAELWANRSWTLLDKWMASPSAAWTAPGLIPADGDVGRSAIVEAGRKTVDDLTPLLRANGIRFSYPMLIWWTNDGRMRGCACFSAAGYRNVRRELGVKG